MDHHAEASIHTLIMAKPGILRTALHAFLRAIPAVEITAFADTPEIALKIAHEHRPELIVVDVDVSESQTHVLIQQIRAEHSRAKLIALVENIRQQMMMLNSGADYALLKGFLNEELRNAVFSQTEGKDRTLTSADERRQEIHVHPPLRPCSGPGSSASQLPKERIK